MPSLLGVEATWTSIAVIATACAGTLLVGARLTRIDAWYQGLEKPPWTPPGATIAVVWWALFALLAVSMVLVWNTPPRDGRTLAAMGLFAITLVLNAGWSYLFFWRREPNKALGEVGLLGVAVLVLLLLSSRKSLAAGAMLVPYLAWVVFAGYLNWTIVRMNPAAAPARTRAGHA